MPKPQRWLIHERDIIVLGECFVEFSLLPKNRTKFLGLGGDCLTVAAAAARLGSKVDMITAIGLDPFGEYIREECGKENIDLSYAQTVEGYNGVYASHLGDADLRECAFYRPGSAALSIGSTIVHDEHIGRAKIVHSSTITQSISPGARKAVFKAFELCHLNGGMTSYDPNLRLRLWSLEDAKEAIWSVMPFIDVIFPSAPDETKVLFGYERPIDVIGFLWDHGVNVVVVKNGEHGCVVGYDGKVEEIPAASAAPVSYTCVGSAFCGGFLHGIVRGFDPFKSARIAVEIAGRKLSGPGGLRNLPRGKEISHLL